MRFLPLLLLLLLCVPVFGDTSNDVVAIQALIDRFDDTEIIITTEPWYQTRLAFVDHAEAVAEFGECAVDPLIKVLEDENLQVRVAAAVALEKIGPAAIKASPLLREMLQSDDDRTNILACGIIRGIGPGALELVDLVIAQLDNENFHVQYWACRALGGAGSCAESATDELVELLETGFASVRRNAALALGKIYACRCDQAPIHVVAALERVIENDYSVPVKAAAKEALKNIHKVPC